MNPAGVLRGSGNPHGVFCPFSDVSAEVYSTRGFQPPVRSVSRVSHPLDGLLPPSLPITRIGAAPGVHPSELSPRAKLCASRRRCPHAVSDITSFCSEDQEVKMPRGSRALFPARIRTPSGQSPEEADTLLGFKPLQSFPAPPWRRLPAPFPHVLPVPPLRETEHPALQGLAERIGRLALAGQPTLLRFTTRTCPRLLPTTVMSCR